MERAKLNVGGGGGEKEGGGDWFIKSRGKKRESVSTLQCRVLQTHSAHEATKVPGTSTARVQLASAAEVALAISALNGQELQVHDLCTGRSEKIPIPSLPLPVLASSLNLNHSLIENIPP